MPTYGRNFWFLMAPETENRLGRWVTPATGTWILGSPVSADDAAGIDTLGRQTVKAGVQGAPPVKGRCGVLIYEHIAGSIDTAGVDPLLTTYSDYGTAPLSKAVQVVSGPNVRLVLKNTDATTFLTARTYAARNMLPETGATPQFNPGDLLEPHSSPSDSNGYWQKTATQANAWLVVTKADGVNQEIECQMLF